MILMSPWEVGVLILVCVWAGGMAALAVICFWDNKMNPK